MPFSEVKFRNGPVRHTRKVRGGSRYYRNIAYAQAKRSASDPEVELYIRPARRIRSLPDIWDLEPVRMRYKSWKNQGKCRKQWEHRLNNKKSNAYVTKDYGGDKIETETVDNINNEFIDANSLW